MPALLAAHRGALSRSLPFGRLTFTVNRTDHPAESAMLMLHSLLSNERVELMSTGRASIHHAVAAYGARHNTGAVVAASGNATCPTPRLPRRSGFISAALNEETPDRTPWWLILPRMILAAMTIVALAISAAQPGGEAGGSGPLVVVVDDGWASAADWQVREQKTLNPVDQADRESRPVPILLTAPSSPGELIHQQDERLKLANT